MKEIPIFYAQASFRHDPRYEIFNGEKEPHAETADRVVKILEALRSSTFAHIHTSTIASMPWVEQVHDSAYLQFLQDTSKQAAREEKSLYPSVHPYVHDKHPTNPIAKRGFYVYDTYTPIMKNTFEVALESAACAVAGAKFLLGGERTAYALTRPPGHHAGRALAGGYCYINNVAVAAEYLIKNGVKKVAIFDFDFHHGNGTQGIFYQRPDVLVISVHADPKDKFPFYTGYRDEIGRGNRTLGQSINKLSRPTLTVQEGGYATEVLGDNVASYLQGFLD